MFRKYLAALWADWVARMSGAASVILAFLAAYLEFIVKHGRAALWATAAVCFGIASYRIWAKEHQAVQAKQAELDAALADKEAASPGQAKRQYIIERLQQLIKEDAEVNTSGWIEITDGAGLQHAGRVKRFLADYLGESYVKRYEEQRIVALEQILLELLEMPQITTPVRQ